jgi:hypothetical protein
MAANVAATACWIWVFASGVVVREQPARKQEQAKGQREKRTVFHPKIITEKPRQFATGLFLSILFF